MGIREKSECGGESGQWCHDLICVLRWSPWLPCGGSESVRYTEVVLEISGGGSLYEQSDRGNGEECMDLRELLGTEWMESACGLDTRVRGGQESGMLLDLWLEQHGEWLCGLLSCKGWTETVLEGRSKLSFRCLLSTEEEIEAVSLEF